MKYTCESLIDCNRDTVSRLYTDFSLYSRWQPNFASVERFAGEDFQPGFHGVLNFHGDNKVRMEMFVEMNHLPDQLSCVYQVADVWNRCIDTFKEVDGKTHWLMDVEFRFKEDMTVHGELFKQATQKSMDQFRDFVMESLESSG
jgi:hypothetical protein